MHPNFPFAISVLLAREHSLQWTLRLPLLVWGCKCSYHMELILFSTNKGKNGCWICTMMINLETVMRNSMWQISVTIHILLKCHLALGTKRKPMATSNSACWLGKDCWIILPEIKLVLTLSTSSLLWTSGNLPLGHQYSM